MWRSSVNTVMVILFWGSSGVVKLYCYYRVISLWDSSAADSPFLDISAVAAPQFLPLQASNAAKHQKYYTPPTPPDPHIWVSGSQCIASGQERFTKAR